jgi:hypothetical protein
MEEVRNNSGQTLGIIALIAAVITFVLAVVPCVGIIAIIPGIVAIVIASIGLSQAERRNQPKGILIAGLIIGIVASLISFSQIFIAGKIADKASGELPGEIQNIIHDIRHDVLNDLQDSDISIRIQSEGNKIEINAINKEDKQKQLEELESGSQSGDSLKKVK